MKLFLLAATGVVTLGAGVGVVGSGRSPDHSTRPGPDSAAIVRMFGALGSADPVVCEFTADQLRNGWSWSSDASQIAALRDHTADDRAVKDMFNQDVKDAKAIRVLGSHLSDPNPCLRRTAAQLLGGSNNDEAVRTLR